MLFIRAIANTMSTFWSRVVDTKIIYFVLLGAYMYASLSFDPLRFAKIYSDMEDVKCKISENKKNESIAFRDDGGNQTVTIIYWTKFFNRGPWKEFLASVNKLPCFEMCRVITNRLCANNSDAILFHAYDMSLKDLPIDTPNIRSKQIWVYVNQESPSTHPRSDLSKFNNRFNWTMTYRRDSDIHHYYGQIVKRIRTEEPYKVLSTESLKKKKKSIFWIVSHCKTKGNREHLVEELRKFIDVDIYGKCGNYSCSRENGGCFSELSEQYRFYLSFENSLCVDYVTEKRFRALKHNVIPVVYGGANYSSFMPPDSYIDVKNFTSVQELSNYLLYLEHNSEEYLKYFGWKKLYIVKPEPPHGVDSWCDLCKLLMQQRNKPQPKIYRDLNKWWNFVNAHDTNKLNTNSNESFKSEVILDDYISPACNDNFTFLQ